MRLSKSKVLDFVRCPKYFKMCYIDQLPQEKGLALQRGSDIHEVLDYFNSLNGTFTERMIEVRKHGLYKKYEPVINKFLLEWLKISGGSFKVLAHELKIFDEVLNISGVIDLVVQDNDSVLLIDYKTGQPHDLDNYRFELGVYVHLFVKNGGVKPSHWGVFFVDDCSFLIEEVSDEMIDDALKRLVEVRESIKKHQEQGVFEAVKGIHCRWCSYRKECEKQ